MFALIRITLVLTFFSQIAVAQFNDSINYFLHYGSTGILNKTNSGKSYILNNNLRFNVHKKSYRINTFNNWTYGKQNSTLTNNDYFSSFDFNLYKSIRHFYYWGMGNYEKSLSLGVNHRLQGGMGVGYNIIDRDKIEFILSDGILYEQSDLYDTEESDNKYSTYRNSFRLKLKVHIKNKLSFESTDFVQHSLEDKHDYIVKLSTNLSIHIYKWVSLITTVNYNKVNRTGKETFFLNYGLSFERYF